MYWHLSAAARGALTVLPGPVSLCTEKAAVSAGYQALLQKQTKETHAVKKLI